MVEEKWIVRVMDNLLRNSEEKNTYKNARHEWVYAGLEDNEVCDMECELCGHEDIRYEFTIKNKLNSNELIVGSSCIEKFLDYLSDNRETMEDNTGTIVNKKRINDDKKLYWIKITNQYLNDNFYSSDFQIDITNKVEQGEKLTINQAKSLRYIYGRLDELGKTALRNTIKIKMGREIHKGQYSKLKPFEKQFVDILLSSDQKKTATLIY